MRRIILLLFLAKLAFSQNLNLRFDKISTKDGLNQSTVATILQDNKGFMWFGTQSGLNRYDGYTFKIFNDLKNTDARYASVNITSIVEDINDNIWIGTATNGISILNTKTGKFNPLSSTEEAAKSINQIFIDSHNNVWVATEGAGLQKYSLDFRLQKTFKNSSDNLSLSSNRISCVFEDENGFIWIGTADAGLNRINPENDMIKNDFLKKDHTNVTVINQDDKGILWVGTVLDGILLVDPVKGEQNIYLHDNNNKNSLAHNTIHTIFEDSKNRFWIGTDGGLSLFLPKLNLFYNFHRDPQNPSGLSSDQILSIYEDRSGIIWLGTSNNGLNRFSSAYAVFNNYQQNPNDRNSLNTNEIWALYEEKPGYVWIGTDKGLSLWNIEENRFKHFESNTYPGALNYNIIRTIAPYKNGKLLVGTNGGGLNIFDPSNGQCKYYTFKNVPGNLSDNHIRSILKNDDGSYWIGTMGGLNLFKADEQQFQTFKNIPGNDSSLCDNRILDMLKDNRGRLWLATYNGLSMMKENGSFLNFRHDAANENSISNNLTVCLFQSPREEKILWIGTLSGLNRLDLATMTVTRFVQKEQQANNVIYSILEDDQNYLWLGTNKGLARFDKKDGSFKNFGLYDGIRNDEFNANSACKLSDGRLLMGGIAGITGFLPSEIRKNSNIPNVVITSFKIYENEISIDSLMAYDKALELNYDDKFISFEFAALDYVSSGKNKYKYMLEGFDDEWNNANNRRFASYTNLDGGEYIFKVIGSNNDGVWNKVPTQLKILVKPPFWKTIWFRVLSTLLVILGGLSFYHIRINRIDTQRKELQVKVNERTKELYRRNLELVKIQKEKDRILQNVEEGFFLIDKEYKIQSQHSAALLKILNIDSVAGKSFFDMLAEYLPEKTCTMAREYIDLLFDDSLDEELIADLNPMDQLEFHFRVQNATSVLKFLTFKVKRIHNDDDQIEGLIITVIDETEEHLLSIQLRETESRSKKQIEWLMGILHVDSNLLYEFMNSTFSELDYIEKWLKSDAINQNEYFTILDNIARSLHLIKGNANLLDLKFFAQQVHNIEDKTIEIKNTEQLGGSDFLPLVMQLNGLRNTLNELNSLIGRLSQFNAHKSTDTQKDKKTTVSFLDTASNLIRRMANDLEKKALFDHSKFKTELVPPQYKLLIKNIVTQLSRNSLAHGIESVEEREALGKPNPARIEISNQVNGNAFLMQFKDDGRGLQLQKLREKALESERWPHEEIDKWDRDTLAEVIFTPGISSANSSDLFSGRGIGMDLIREQLKKHSGKIEVDFKESEYCLFTITLPLVNEN